MDEKKIGYCGFCGQGNMVEAAEGYEQADLDLEATYKCHCEGARRMREREAQKEEALSNIEQLVSQKYPEMADILYECVNAIQEGKVRNVTVSNDEGVKAILTSNLGKIRLKLSKTDNWEISA